MKKIIFFLVVPHILLAQFANMAELPSSLTRHKTSHLTPLEAKKSLGYPQELIDNPMLIMNAQTPIVIIDSGFHGINAFLNQNPQYKKNIKKWYVFGNDGKPSKSKHGLDVLKSALSNAPHATFHLYEQDRTKPKASMKKTLETMAKNGLHLANVSVGQSYFLGLDSSGENQWLLDLLEKYEITLFVAIANSRKESHYFKYSDKNNNNYLEFVEGIPETTAEANRILVQKNNRVDIKVYWQRTFKKDIGKNIAIELVDEKGAVLEAKNSHFTNAVSLAYKPTQTQYAWIKIKDKGITNAENIHFMLHVKNFIAHKTESYFNGFGIINKTAAVESPFIIAVGSYGKGENGKLLPSSFSSYGKTTDGQVLPHVLGPGELDFGEEKIKGTSLSAPYLTAFLSRFPEYNPKNLIESISAKERLDASLKPIETSRWGVPAMKKMTFSNTCFSSNKVTNYKGDFTKEAVVISFDFSRKCMEGMVYKLFLRIEAWEEGAKRRAKILTFPSAVFKSKTKNIENQKVTFEIPFDKLPSQYKKFTLANLLILTRAAGKEPKMVMGLNGEFDNPTFKKKSGD